MNSRFRFPLWLTGSVCSAGLALLAVEGKVDVRIIAGALAIALLFLAAEWHTLQAVLGIERMSLARVENSVRRIPHTSDVIVANVLTVLFVVLSVQFVAIVYAMAFTSSQSTTEMHNTLDVVLGDFDNDGDLDWIAGNSDNGAPSEDYDIYANNGFGNLTHVGTINGFSSQFTKLRAGDVDGDGDLDIVCSQLTPHYTVSVLKNNGGFSFSQGYVYNYATETAGVDDTALFDVDNDGDLDIIAVIGSNITNALHLNDGHGNFTVTASPLPVATRITWADFTGDGAIDIALSKPSFAVQIYKNSGTGAFVQLQNVSGISGVPKALVPADIDGDGDIDIVAPDNSNPSYAQIIVNDGDETFSFVSAGSVYNYGVSDLATADFDNDGDIDWVDVAKDNSVPSNGNELWLNDGMGNFTSNWQASGGDDSSSSLAVGDLDNDGDVDYVLGRDGPNANEVLLSDRAATTPNTAPSAPSTFSGAVIGRTPRSASSFANDSAVGTVAWQNLTDAASSNNVYVQTSSMAPGEITQYLESTDFGYNIPSTATINGIKIEVEKRNSAGTTVIDNSVRILKGGSYVGNNKADTVTNWSGSDTYVSYGGPSDLWGTTWTPSDINASNFGFGISAQAVTAGAPAAYIDHVRITVYYTQLDVRLTWGSGSDVETPTRLLQYQVRVGTGSNAHNIVSGRTASPFWVNRLMPNNVSRSITLRNIVCRSGLTYYWSVTTVDTGFKTATSAEQTFSLDNSCANPFSGGGGGSSSPGVGGGLPASYFHGGNLEDTASAGKATLTVAAYTDLNGNGIKDGREQYGFAGLALTASGRTADLTVVHKTSKIGPSGTASFEMLPSDDRGYWVLVDTGSSVLSGYEPTGMTASGGYVLRSGSVKRVEFGFRRADLLSYRPCLTIGAPAEDERRDTDAGVLLQRLEDAFGQKAMRGIDLKDKLVTRKEFFTLLARTHCTELIRNADDLEKKLRESAKETGFRLPLVDMKANVTNAESLLVHSLLAEGADVVRQTSIGDAADLSSPITRGEAIRAVVTILHVPADKKVTMTDETLPDDLEANDPLVTDFLTLKSLGILPMSFHTILGQNQGINPDEVVLLLTRAAFRGGKIDLLPPSVGTKKAASSPTFLSELPTLKERACLEKDADRSSTVFFSDVLPGDPQYAELRDLMARGVKNSAKQVLWLMAGTRRPTEFGIPKGQTKADLDEPVSVLETIRNLLVLSCLPPDTAIDVMSGKSRNSPIAGSGESRIARDRISNLPRDATFASRVLYKSQDHQKEFDLSLFTYAPSFLRKESRSPASGLSVSEASDILASALLMIHVKAKTLTPQEAEKHAESLSMAIRKELLGKDIDWRDESAIAKVPFTKGMLISFLSTAVSGRTTKIPATTSLPLGEIWWERVK